MFQDPLGEIRKANNQSNNTKFKIRDISAKRASKSGCDWIGVQLEIQQNSSSEENPAQNLSEETELNWSADYMLVELLMITMEDQMFREQKMQRGRYHAGKEKEQQKQQRRLNNVTDGGGGRASPPSSYFSTEAILVLACVTVSLLVLPLILPPLPPPPTLLLLLPVCLLMLLVVLAFMPTDMRSMASSYL
ncbi:hypothetical protein E2562_016096 [Oryza meyeriana var. granulata]|uniref:ARGOS-like protein n=1 Tax=Oryza meyeriana var. granulata TaxID=110450 RepID=A0A6G1BLN8_9ORYZ|nr:hypothetical protein E2562_016096 [Oryza meyeriana var. granulata]